MEKYRSSFPTSLDSCECYDHFGAYCVAHCTNTIAVKNLAIAYKKNQTHWFHIPLLNLFSVSKAVSLPFNSYFNQFRILRSPTLQILITLMPHVLLARKFLAVTLSHYKFS